MARNKYNAVRCGGYDSKAEQEYAMVLELLERAGQIREWVHHPPAVQLTASIKWKVDYKVLDTEGEPFWVEVKGMPTEGYSLKLRLWKDLMDDPLFVVRRYGELRFKVLESVNTGTILAPVGASQKPKVGAV